jgi:hypothetical protein
MTSPYKAIAQRIVNAENSFVETLMRCGNISKEDATKVMNLYLKKKLAKMDAVIGRISVKHGAFLDPHAIANAVKMVNSL